MAWAAIVGGVVALGTTAYAASQRPNAGGATSYGDTTEEILRAQRDALAPNYQADLGAGGSLHQAALQSRVNYQNAFGSQGTPFTSAQGWTRNGQPLERAQQEWVDEMVARGLTIDQIKAQLGSVDRRGRPGTYEAATAGGGQLASPGLIAMAEEAAPRLNKLQADQQTYARERGIADVTQLGPDAMNALRLYDPRSTAGADLLYDETFADAQLGSEMDQSMIRSDEQKTRNSWSSVLGYSPEAAVQERMSLGYAGLALKNQRQQALGNVINQRSQLYGDPFRILGISDSRNTNPNAFMTAGPASINGASAIGPATQLYSQNQGYQNQANIAAYNQNNANMNQYGYLAGNVFGSLFNAGGRTPNPTTTYYNSAGNAYMAP